MVKFLIIGVSICFLVFIIIFIVDKFRLGKFDVDFNVLMMCWNVKLGV